MPNTPDEWLPILAARLDYRYARVEKLRRYATGDADLPEMGKNLRASWVAFQRKARTDYGGLAVGSLADRLRLQSIMVGGQANSPESVQARRIWRDNRMDVQLADVIEDYLTCGIGYLVAGADGTEAQITREMPEQFYAATNPLRPWKARAAIKVWRDPDAGADYALVWAVGLRQMYKRSSFLLTGDDSTKVLRNVASGGWLLDGPSEAYLGDPPVVILERKGSKGLFEPHLDVIDRINLGKLQRLVIAAMQAFRQRAVKGDLPDKDPDGNDIDWAKILEPAPGAMWELPEGIDIWESQATDIRPLLDGEKEDQRTFAAVTRTPLSAFTPDGANQSATGATNAAAEQIAQARNEIARIVPGLQVILVYGLRIEGFALEEETLEVQFENPAIIGDAEKYAAAQAAKTAGMSWDSIARTILGWSPDLISQDSLARSQEQLMALTLVQASAPAPAQQMPQPQPVDGNVPANA